MIWFLVEINQNSYFYDELLISTLVLKIISIGFQTENHLLMSFPLENHFTANIRYTNKQTLKSSKTNIKIIQRD